MIPDLDELFPPDQADLAGRAAANIQMFLQELAFQFESRYCAELRRHLNKQHRHYDPNHPWLFLPSIGP